MRRPLLALLIAFSALTFHALAQLPAKPNPLLVTETVNDQGGGPGKMNGTKLDIANWSSPLAPVTKEEKRFFRTIRNGWVGFNARTEYAGESSMIIGFECHVGKVEKTISVNSIRPIYIIRGQKVPGAMVGVAKGAVQRVLAKDGYAVSDVTFVHTVGLSGIRPKFARILPDGTLNPADNYNGEPLGAGGDGMTLRMGNIPFCGIYNSPADVPEIGGIALLVSQDLVRQKKTSWLPRANADFPSIGREVQEPGQPAPAPAAEPRRPTSELVVVEKITPEINQQINDVLRTANERLVLVSGQGGKGSGFICKLDGKPTVLTNQHVVAGNQKFELNSLARGQLKYGEARAAVAHDLVAFALPEDVAAFELPADFLKEVGMGDPVIVLGDADGAGVVRPALGRIMGIGPNLVEISAQILPGNSGSPIIHLRTGKVIGIASYVTAKAFDAGQGRVAAEVRRFGFRIDSAQKWQPVDWAIYQGEAAAMTSSAAFTETLFKILEAVINGTFTKTAFLEPRLAQAMQAIPNTIFKAPTPTERGNITTNFMRALRAAVKAHSDDMRRRLRYDFFQRDSADAEKMREAIVDEIDKMKERLPLNPTPRR